MRTVLIIALLVCIAALAGWVSFSDRGDTATIQLDKQEALEETRDAVETVGEAVEDTVEGIERQFDSDDDEEIEETPPRN
jgi:hypothetical protein